MTDLVAGLLLYPTFRDIPVAAMEATRGWWQGSSLAAGERLWAEGEPGNSLAIVLRGEMSVHSGGGDLGPIGNGGILGEASAFFRDQLRTATVTATRPTELAVLPVEGLAALRAAGSPAYTALLDQGLRALVRRIRAADRRIASLAPGRLQAPERVDHRGLAGLWRKLAPGTPKGECPPLGPLLRAQPGMESVTEQTLAEIAAGFTAQALPSGEVLFLEGEQGTSAWLIAEGAVDVLRHVGGHRAERLATLNGGDLVGINVLIEPAPRTASCVAVQPTWAWRLDARAADALTGEAHLRWRECMLAALTTQIRLAHAALGSFGADNAPPSLNTSPEVDRLLRATGYLEGLPLDARDLAGARVMWAAHPPSSTQPPLE